MERTGKRKNFIILILFAVFAAASVLAVFGCGALHGQALAEVAAVSEESAAHDHNDGEWTALTSDGGTLAAGKYYLAEDVTLTTDLTISGEVTLCLNGHELRGAEAVQEEDAQPVIKVEAGADFTLCDCVGTGIVTGGSGLYDGQAYSRGGGVYVAENASFTLTGGSISGNSVEHGEGGGVYISEGGTFTMSGGSISDNTCETGYGGGVYLNNAAFTMSGGSISGNACTHAGGGVYASGTFRLTGGEISDNTAGSEGASSAKGGGVAVDGIGTEAYLSGGRISGNKVYGNGDSEYGLGMGGGIHVNWAVSVFEMSGGPVEKNYAQAGGGGIVSIAGEAEAVRTIGGGSVTGNTEGENVPSGVYASAIAVLDYKAQITGGYYTAELEITPVQDPNYKGSYILVDLSADRWEEGYGDPDYDPNFPKAVYKLCYVLEVVDGVTAYVSEQTFGYDGAPVDDAFAFTDDSKDIGGRISIFDGDHAVLKYSTRYYYTEAGSDALIYGLPTEIGNYSVTAVFLGGVDGIDGTTKRYYNYLHFSNKSEEEVEALTKASFTLHIVKGDPKPDVPSGLSICTGSVLSDITLPSGWSWQNGAVSVGEPGETPFAAVFTPEDTDHYDVITRDISVSVLGHEWGEWTVIVPPSEKEDGSESRSCSRCGKNETRVLPASGETPAAHDHNDGSWTALTADGGVLTAGKYYLAGDVTLTTDLTISGEVTLCLNGHKLTGTRTGSVITVNNGANFTLCDCSTEANNVVGGVAYTTGVVTGGSASYGGGVYVNANGTFTMSGGTIANNTADVRGGGVYCEGGTFSFSGGTVANNNANQGGGICLTGGSAQLSGDVVIAQNQANHGGGVYVYIMFITEQSLR